MKGMLAMFLLDLYGCFVRRDTSFAAAAVAAAVKFRASAYSEVYSIEQHVKCKTKFWVMTVQVTKTGEPKRSSVPAQNWQYCSLWKEYLSAWLSAGKVLPSSPRIY